MGKIKPIPSNEVTATPINIVQLLELKFVILGPTPLLIKFTPEYQNIINNPITINTDEINETIDNLAKFLINTKGINRIH